MFEYIKPEQKQKKRTKPAAQKQINSAPATVIQKMNLNLPNPEEKDESELLTGNKINDDRSVVRFINTSSGSGGKWFGHSRLLVEHKGNFPEDDRVLTNYIIELEARGSGSSGQESDTDASWSGTVSSNGRSSGGGDGSSHKIDTTSSSKRGSSGITSSDSGAGSEVEIKIDKTKKTLREGYGESLRIGHSTAKDILYNALMVKRVEKNLNYRLFVRGKDFKTLNCASFIDLITTEPPSVITEQYRVKSLPTELYKTLALLPDQTSAPELDKKAEQERRKSIMPKLIALVERAKKQEQGPLDLTSEGVGGFSRPHILLDEAKRLRDQ